MKAARERAGLSQAQAAAGIGVHEMTISKWERGTMEMGADKALRLAALYGVSLDELTEAPVVSENVPRGTASRVREPAAAAPDGARPERGEPRSLRILKAEFELEALKAGATEGDMDLIRNALESPGATQLYSGGYAEPLSIEEQELELRSTLSLLREWLTERIRRRNEGKRHA